MKILKSLILSSALIANLASATIVDLGTIVESLSKQDQIKFYNIANKMQPGSKQVESWKTSSGDTVYFGTQGNLTQDGYQCKTYQVALLSGAYSDGIVCNLSDSQNPHWIFQYKE